MGVRVRYYGVPKEAPSITRISTTTTEVAGVTFYNIQNGGFWLFTFSQDVAIRGVSFTAASGNPNIPISMTFSSTNGTRETESSTLTKRNTIHQKDTKVKQVIVTFGASCTMTDISIGIVKDIEAEEIKSCKVTNALDYKKWEFPSSTAKVVFQDKEGISYMFKQREKVKIIFTKDGVENLIGTYYINETQELGKNTYSIDMIDAIGVLDTIIYDGYVIDNPVTYNEIIRDIVTEFELEFDYEPTYPDISSGVILAGTKKDALQQVMFIFSNYFCLTAGTDKIKITNRAPSLAKEMDEAKTYNKATITNETPATSYNIAIHTFNSSTEGQYYAAGNHYTDEYRFHKENNPNAVEDNNGKSCNGATLINEDNWNTQIDSGWKFSFKLNTIYKNRFVWDGENVGDYVKVASEGEFYRGFIEKMTYYITNTCVVDMEIRVYDL